jgi:hypothetical protein
MTSICSRKCADRPSSAVPVHALHTATGLQHVQVHYACIAPWASSNAGMEMTDHASVHPVWDGPHVHSGRATCCRLIKCVEHELANHNDPIAQYRCCMIPCIQSSFKIIKLLPYKRCQVQWVCMSCYWNDLFHNTQQIMPRSLTVLYRAYIIMLDNV